MADNGRKVWWNRERLLSKQISSRKKEEVTAVNNMVARLSSLEGVWDLWR